MINILKTSINVSRLTADITLTVGDTLDYPRFLILKLDEINHTNTDVANAKALSLDWPHTKSDTYYHLENGVLTETPASPGPTYNFDYTHNVWKDSRTINDVWTEVKQKRNLLISSSDWTQLSDIPQALKDKWIVYRQALRDITTQQDPYNITWPTPPQ
jgi:hypothetical protein